MIRQLSLPIFIAAAITLLFACNSKQTADQSLKDDNQRKDIIGGIVHHQTYMTEMIHEMMNNDSCKQMMMDNVMIDPSMKGMRMDKMMSTYKDNSSMCKMMMGKTMEMCDADRAKCKMMMGAMQSHPAVVNSMKEMCSMKNMKK
ncbi:MAG: hypothetical protein ABI315_13100 [Bacteroidia bacterium]